MFLPRSTCIEFLYLFIYSRLYKLEAKPLRVIVIDYHVYHRCDDGAQYYKMFLNNLKKKRTNLKVNSKKKNQEDN